MKKDLRLIATSSILFVATGFVLSIVLNKYEESDGYVPAAVTALGSLVIGLIPLLWQLRRDVAEIHQLHEDRKQQIEAFQAEAKVAGTLIHEAVSAARDSVSELESGIRKEMEVARTLVGLLSRDTQGLTRTRMSLSRRSEVIQRMGNNTLEEFHKIFRPTGAGYRVQGEHQALMAYRVFWQELLRLQRSVKKQHGDSDAHRLIARVTHSNDVELWMPDHHQVAQDLLDLQKDFVGDGGRIVRLFVSPAPDPSDRYDSTIGQMKDYQIEARFLQFAGKYAYDFIWISNPQHNIVLTWHSGLHGRGLDHCEVWDGVEPHIPRMWRQFAKVSEAREGYFDAIPESRRLSDLETDF